MVKRYVVDKVVVDKVCKKCQTRTWLTIFFIEDKYVGKQFGNCAEGKNICRNISHWGIVRNAREGIARLVFVGRYILYGPGAIVVLPKQLRYFAEDAGE